MKSWQNIHNLILFVFAICLISNPETTSGAAKNALILCGQSIIPGLFPLFVLSDCWIKCGGTRSVAEHAAPFMERLFHISGNAAAAFILGCTGGYPIGAKVTAQLYKNGQLSKSDAEQALLFCNNAGPAFCIGVIGTMLNNTRNGIYLYLVHITAAIIVGIVYRPKTRNDYFHPTEQEHQALTFTQALTASITDAGMTILRICAFIIFFMIVNHQIAAITPRQFLCILPGLIELAGGTAILHTQNLSNASFLILTSFLLGFGGFCVYMQSAAFIVPAGLSGKKMLLGKLTQACISAVLMMPITFLKKEASCFSIFNLNISRNFPHHQFLVIIILAIWLLIVKISSGKTANHRL